MLSKNDKLEHYFDLLARLVANLNEIDSPGNHSFEQRIKNTLKVMAEILSSEIAFVARYDTDDNNILIEHLFPEDAKIKTKFRCDSNSIWRNVIDHQDFFGVDIKSLDQFSKDAGIQSVIAAPFTFDENEPNIIACCNKFRKGLYPYEIYGSDEGKILFNLSRMITERLQKDKIIQSDLEKAAQVQKQLLPKMIPSVEGYDLSYKTTSAQIVGGDYCDFLPISGNKLLIIIGDVSGKGLSAALVLVIVRSFLHFIYDRYNKKYQIQQLLFDLNNIIFESVGPNIYVTFLVSEINIENNTLKICNAGHWQPILYKSSNDSVNSLDKKLTNLPIGMKKDTLYLTHNIKINTNDILFFYTDGITESFNGDEFYGEERLMQTFYKFKNHDAKKIIDCVLNDINNFCGKNELQDDASIIVLKRQG